MLCKRLSVPYTCDHAKLTGDMHDAGVEARARDARYRLLLARAKACKADALLLAHHIDCRQVDGVVPLCRCIGHRGACLLVRLHPLGHPGYLGLERRSFPQNGHPQIGIGANLIHLGGLQEARVFSLQGELVGLDVQRQRNSGLKDQDLGPDRCHPLLAGRRHAVVTVDDKIGIPDLKYLNGRQRPAVSQCVPDAVPTLMGTVFQWVEAACEFRAAAHAADDGIEGDLAPNLPTGSIATKHRLHLVEAEELCRAPGEARPPALGVGTTPSPAKAIRLPKCWIGWCVDACHRSLLPITIVTPRQCTVNKHHVNNVFLWLSGGCQ
ncbi:MAG: ATP-binding protein [Anaerolineae bacterium]